MTILATFGKDIYLFTKDTYFFCFFYKELDAEKR